MFIQTLFQVAVPLSIYNLCLKLSIQYSYRCTHSIICHLWEVQRCRSYRSLQENNPEFASKSFHSEWKFRLTTQMLFTLTINVGTGCIVRKWLWPWSVTWQVHLIFLIGCWTIYSMLGLTASCVASFLVASFCDMTRISNKEHHTLRAKHNRRYNYPWNVLAFVL